MRSLVTCLEYLLIAQDQTTWNHTTTLKALQTLLILSLDSRPKPRKRAQEAVRNIVTRPPLMMMVHPGMKVVVQTTLQILKESGNGVASAAGAKDKDNATQMILHTLQLVRMVGKAWPAEVTIQQQKDRKLTRHNDDMKAVDADLLSMYRFFQ